MSHEVRHQPLTATARAEQTAFLERHGCLPEQIQATADAVVRRVFAKRKRAAEQITCIIERRNGTSVVRQPYPTSPVGR